MVRILIAFFGIYGLLTLCGHFGASIGDAFVVGFMSRQVFAWVVTPRPVPLVDVWEDCIFYADETRHDISYSQGWYSISKGSEVLFVTESETLLLEKLKGWL
jgi:hypothetical protein